MMEALLELGNHLIGKDVNNSLSIFIEDLEEGTHVFCIILKKEPNGYEYNGITVEEYERDKKEKYLYRRGSSRGTNVTPSALITETRTEAEKPFKNKTFKNKILNWFKNNKCKNNKNNDGNSIFNEIYNCLKQNEKNIENDIKKELQNLRDKNDIMLTLKFKDNNEEMYIGDYEIYRDCLLEGVKEEYYIKYGKQSIGKNAVCSLCLKEVEEVYGFTSNIFPFYTLDKYGFAPDFNQENGWKLYPVCIDCARKLEAGKRYIEEKQKNLNIYGGIKYYLIPKLILTSESDIYHNFLDLFEEYAKNPSFSKEKRGWIGNLISTEDWILELLSEMKNELSLNFVFYEQPKPNQLKILLYINEILPSRLRKLYDTKKDIDDTIKTFLKDDKLSFNFKIIYEIFMESEGKDISEEYYLDTIERIFTDRQIDYHLLLKFLMRRIQKNFINEESTKDLTINGFMLFKYLYELKILSGFGGEKNMDQQIPSEMLGQNIKYEKYEEIARTIFDGFKEFFDTNAKKGIFLEGVLVQKLLNIQFRDRKSTPFYKKLNGLKLNKDRVLSLLPEAQGKLEEYEKNYYKELETLISDYFVASGKERWPTNNEISFYFV
ncbi:MAG: TIGR02556 family CRISPR-associated protein, partial [Thermoproteota archaeon]